ncbi:hypothetical protein KDX38_20450 [Pseudomonas sp. CDFA 602]|uniref:hypothetical protein n=1 Tax=Pseudomonas californiensis TaxID=2829823 RepID=UPI001E2FC13A|nr:hypothetical protein [Pseudomonas californiensis]MCD5995984.1 hypothetical protein [Pseudomonas californiensis]MCD6001575.1 hypothetical protein [Pseudomonas californiensis]
MDSRQSPEDDGVIRIQRLVPGQVDVVLGSHPRRQHVARPRKKHAYGFWIAALLVVALLSALIGSRLHAPKVVPVPAVGQIVEKELPVEPEATQPMTASPAPASLRLQPYVVPAAPATAQSATVQPLDNCLKDGNVIDESVLNCRFGQVPRSTHSEPAKGMVSAGYMADFKAGATRPAERPSKSYMVSSNLIREWDGRNRYRAQWRIYGNTIDGDSVCENFPARSVERRECRKSAQVNFREQCQEWSKRAVRNKDEQSKDTEHLYCEAASTFTP